MDFTALVTIMALSTTPVVGAPEKIAGQFRNTWYYVVQESDFAKEAKTVDLLDMKDRVLARVSKNFKENLRIEGSAKLMDGRVVNFAGRKNNESRYRITKNPYGDGYGTCVLVPFHTVAVDPNTLPLGAVVRIAETIGMKLPDGSVHDGIWKAEDIGSAIQKDRIDLFVGAGKGGGAVLEAHGIKHLQALTVEIVTPPAEDTCVRQLVPESIE